MNDRWNSIYQQMIPNTLSPLLKIIPINTHYPQILQSSVSLILMMGFIIMSHKWCLAIKGLKFFCTKGKLYMSDPNGEAFFWYKTSIRNVTKRRVNRAVAGQAFFWWVKDRDVSGCFCMIGRYMDDNVFNNLEKPIKHDRKVWGVSPVKSNPC